MATNRRNMQKRWNLKSTIAGSFLLASFATACTPATPEATEPDVTDEPIAEVEAGEEVQPNVQPEEVVSETAQLVGQTITVRSEPIETISPYAFTISDEQFFGNEPIIVVNAAGEPFVLPPEEDTEVQVTGEVQEFVVAEIEQDLGLELDEELYVEFEDKPAIVAQSVAPAPDPGAITQEPDQYYGERLAVSGEVAEIVAPDIFTLNDEELFAGEDLLVLYPTTGELRVEEDQSVAVTGELRSFVVAELERDYDLGWDPDVVAELEAQFADKPVLIADTVYPSAIAE
ncbi:MAG: hypothetical protein Kow00121_33490 [Elainellaceae cyanobacterium]